MALDPTARRRSGADQILAVAPLANTSRKLLVNTAKLRWRIERDYQDLKQELGLSHYEGRGWRGFHHHATLCIAAYGFLISEREAIPPSGPRNTPHVKKHAIPKNYRPRGSPDPA
ncbi:transposase [Acidocella sp.]|uniref:transposase n=1 Tax=Acidocella sp. TaxID=50710 RepID=UPI00262832B1|nr:transposase [Acidocella sp.]